VTIQQNFSSINQFEHKRIASEVKTLNKNKACTNIKTAEVIARLLQAHWAYQAARRSLRQPYIILYCIVLYYRVGQKTGLFFESLKLPYMLT